MNIVYMDIPQHQIHMCICIYIIYIYIHMYTNHLYICTHIYVYKCAYIPRLRNICMYKPRFANLNTHCALQHAVTHAATCCNTHCNTQQHTLQHAATQHIANHGTTTRRKCTCLDMCKHKHHIYVYI